MLIIFITLYITPLVTYLITGSLYLLIVFLQSAPLNLLPLVTTNLIFLFEFVRFWSVFAYSTLLVSVIKHCDVIFLYILKGFPWHIIIQKYSHSCWLYSPLIHTLRSFILQLGVCNWILPLNICHLFLAGFEVFWQA